MFGVRYELSHVRYPMGWQHTIPLSCESQRIFRNPDSMPAKRKLDLCTQMKVTPKKTEAGCARSSEPQSRVKDWIVKNAKED